MVGAIDSIVDITAAAICMNFLSPDFDPGNNWWGSEVTID